MGGTWLPDAACGEPASSRPLNVWERMTVSFSTDLKQCVPGTVIGNVDQRQHQQAAKAALPKEFKEDKEKPLPEHKLDFSSATALERDLKRILDKNKDSQNPTLHILVLNLALEAHAAGPELTMNPHAVRVMQRMLADRLKPPVHKFQKGRPNHKGSLATLRQRIAVSRGSTVVRYADADGAMELLKTLAEHNSPGVSALLKLTKAGIAFVPGSKPSKLSGTEPEEGGKGKEKSAGTGKTKAEAGEVHEVFTPVIGSECGAEFEINMDMHGVLTKPKSEAIEVPDDSKANEACMHRRLGILYTALTKDWDTVDLHVPLSGTAPAHALQLCFKVMAMVARRNSMDGRTPAGAAAVVRWHEKDKQVCITLAETNANRGHVQLLNSLGVVKAARDAANGMPRDERAQLVASFDAIINGTAKLMRTSYAHELERDVFGDMVEAISTRSAREMGSYGNRASQLANMDLGVSFNGNSSDHDSED